MWETNAFSLSQTTKQKCFAKPAERQPPKRSPAQMASRSRTLGGPAAARATSVDLESDNHAQMSRYCLVPTTWTVTHLQAHTCDDRSHSHISRATRDELLRHGAATWLLTPIERARHNGELPRDAFVHGVIRLKDTYAIRGFSARFGLVKDWTNEIFRLLISEITRRPMEDQQ